MTYHITMVESEEGVAVWCDDLPGCCSQGIDRPDAVANIKTAIREYCQVQEELERDTKARIIHEEVAV
jgi:predicted RNase H-like HicB family nuclease